MVNLNRFLKQLILFTLTLSLCLSWNSFFPQLQLRAEISQSLPIAQQIEQGIDLYRSGQYWQAIEHWEKSLKSTTDNNLHFITLKYLARAYQKVGRFEVAINYFEQLITHYRQTGNSVQLARILIEQAQAYLHLGQDYKALVLLCGKRITQPNKDNEEAVCESDSALKIAQDTNDGLSIIAALGSIGKLLRLQGDFALAIQFLEESLHQAQNIPKFDYIVAALNSLGNVYTSQATKNYRYAQLANQARDIVKAQRFRARAINSDRKAIQYFQATIQQARSNNQIETEARARLNLMLPLTRINSDPELMDSFWSENRAILEQLSDSREKVYLLIKLANFSQIIQHPENLTVSQLTNVCSDSQFYPEAVELLNQAIITAQNIKDDRAQALGMGYLGHFFECQHSYQQALELTQKAQYYERRLENLYQWDWQTGRIFKAQGNYLAATQAYELAVEKLNRIRGNFAIANRELQINFQEAVEPVYRELTELYLARMNNLSKSDEQLQLKSALKTIDELRLSEIQNYLANECELPDSETDVSSIDPQTAIFRTIILPEKMAIILTLPSQNGMETQSRLHWIPIGESQITEIVNDFRLKLEKRSDRAKNYRQTAGKLYDWFINPFLSELKARNIQTLVFIQDGILRTIPMGALYDGQQFLVQQYAIANLPFLGFNQFSSLETEKLKVLAFGLSKPSATNPKTNFASLEYVRLEIQLVQQTFPNSKGLLNEAFTIQRLQQELETTDYSILHLSTHAQFGYDARQTFLVTGEKFTANSLGKIYNQPLTLNRLYQLLQNQNSSTQLTLLTMTACETAAGSSQDALGLAGVALQAGVESAVATLWQVDDRATANLIIQFYQNLQQGIGRAKSLQMAQVAWLEKYSKGRYNHPGYWASFIEIGNWL